MIEAPEGKLPAVRLPVTAPTLPDVEMSNVQTEPLKAVGQIVVVIEIAIVLEVSDC